MAFFGEGGSARGLDFVGAGALPPALIVGAGALPPAFALGAGNARLPAFFLGGGGRPGPRAGAGVADACGRCSPAVSGRASSDSGLVVAGWLASAPRTSAAILARASERMSSPSSEAVSAAFFSHRNASFVSPWAHIAPAVSSAHLTSSESSSAALGNAMSGVMAYRYRESSSGASGDWRRERKLRAIQVGEGGTERTGHSQ